MYAILEVYRMKILVIALASLSITSCSSIRSFESTDIITPEGITYSMPKKDIVVTFTVDSNAVTNIAVATTAAYGDGSKQYVLQHRYNALGKNTSDIKVSEGGLLNTVTSTTTSDIPAIFQNLGTLYGNLSTGMVTSYTSNPIKDCENDGKHAFIFPAGTDVYERCGFIVNIEASTLETEKPVPSKQMKKTNSGIFYRQNESYLVSISGKGVNFPIKVYSPSNSKISFLPASKSLIANNKSEFDLIDGVPKRYHQDVDGEVLAAVKLPFLAIAAAADGAISVLDRSTIKETKKAKLAEENRKRVVIEQRRDDCVKVIQEKIESKEEQESRRERMELLCKDV